jgi:hypothetical protein
MATSPYASSKYTRRSYHLRRLPIIWLVSALARPCTPCSFHPAADWSSPFLRLAFWYTTALLCFPSGYDSIRQVRICLVTHQHRIIDIRKMQLAGTTVPRVQLPSPVLPVKLTRGKVTEAKPDRTTLEICTLASTIGSSNKYLPGCVSLEQALHSSEPFFGVYPP